MIIEDEPSAAERAELAEGNLPDALKKVARELEGGDAISTKEFTPEDAVKSLEVDGEKDLNIAGLTQLELNEATGSKGTVDTSLIEFEVRISCAAEQVLRYSKWWPSPPPEMEADSEIPGAAGGAGDEVVTMEREGVGEGPGVPLWFSTTHQPAPNDIPPCSRCGTPRVFEFQVMPQSLHYLLQENGAQNAISLDFGTLAVYTCPLSCPLAPGQRFSREVVWVQASGANEPPPAGQPRAAI